MKNTVLLALAAALICGSVHAQVKPEDALAYRKSAFRMIVWNFGPMSGMVRGKTPWDAKVFAEQAKRVAQLAPQLLEGFPAGSRVADSEAKAEIWSDWTHFQSRMRDFERESQALATLAQGSDIDATKAQFGKVGGTCKGCHDEYKQD